MNETGPETDRHGDVDWAAPATRQLVDEVIDEAIGDGLDNPAGNPAHEAWQGHTHRWSDEPDDAGNMTCPDCGLVLPFDLVACRLCRGGDHSEHDAEGCLVDDCPCDEVPDDVGD